jgi:glycosyltransferase involved in cell wall biosynthesis
MQAVHRIAGTWNEHVDMYIALTEFGRSRFIKGGLPASKIVVKPNHVPGNGPVGHGRGGYALFVGRLSPEKGIDTLLAAWKHIGSHIPLRIAGVGPMEESVRAAATDGISYLGRCAKEDVAQLMRNASLLVFPSLWYEGCPMVLAEAFSVGLPVVASAFESALVAHGRTGLLFRPGDAYSLVEQVEWALDHPAELSRMRCHARAEYEAKYTPEGSYQSLLQIYNRVLGRIEQLSVEEIAVYD